MKIAYIRVSSKEQSENSNALEQQRQRVLNTGVEKVYCDVDSGSKDKRPQFLQLISDIKAGLITEVVCTRLDRLTRSLIKLREFIKLVEDYNVSLVALDDAVDTTSAVGRFQINMLGSLAEMEVDRLSERIRHGWNHRREQKKAFRPPFGYIVLDDKFELDITPFLCTLHNKKEYSKYLIAQWLLTTFFEVESARQTIKQFNTYFGLFTNNNKYYLIRENLNFSYAGFCQYLRNPVIRGHLVYFQHNKKKETIIIENQHSPLITEKQYQEIERILTQNKSTKRFGQKHPIYPLSGLVVCEECNHHCYYYKCTNKSNITYQYYRCNSYLLKGCTNKQMVRMDKIEQAVMDVLFEKYQEIIKLALTEEKTINPKLNELQKQILTLKSLPQNAIIKDAIAKLQTEIDSLAFQEQQVDIVKNSNYDLLKQVFSTALYWESLTPEEKKVIYHQLISEIYVNKGEIKAITLRL